MHGTERANYSLQDADLVLGLGVRFDDRVIGRPDGFAPNARIVHFDIDATAIERTMRTDIAVVADLAASLKMLLPLVPKADRTAWWERIREWNRDADYPLPLRVRILSGLQEPQLILRQQYDGYRGGRYPGRQETTPLAGG